jgi:predicted metal-dependent HD superfamily phosphohydrolase
MITLKEKFEVLSSKYELTENPYSNWKHIQDSYSQKNRHYHNLNHLQNMFEDLKLVDEQIINKDALFFSIYYHDIIYKATKKDNEYQSALVLKRALEGSTFEDLDYCMEQIELTKSHELSDDKDTNILLDLDLGILGKDWESYLSYTKQIRQEYKIYPNFLYKKGRRKVLVHFLELESIFKTTFFKEKYEQQARANLKKELSILN